MLNLSEKEIAIIKKRNPADVILNELDKAQKYAGFGYSEIFDRFLTWAIDMVEWIEFEGEYQRLLAAEKSKLYQKSENPVTHLVDSTKAVREIIRLEEVYSREVANWQVRQIENHVDERVASHFAIALAVLIDFHNKYEFGESTPTASGSSGRDILGFIYMNFVVGNSQRKYSGQFFTPYPLAKFMSDAAFGTANKDDEYLKTYSENRLLKIAEPACGSGVMVMAAVEWLRRNAPKFWATGNWFIHANDLDRTCTQMCQLNLMVMGVPFYKIYPDGRVRPLVYITCRDALRAPMVEGEVELYEQGQPEQPLQKPQQGKLDLGVVEIATPKTTTTNKPAKPTVQVKAGQLRLFEVQEGIEINE